MVLDHAEVFVLAQVFHVKGEHARSPEMQSSTVSYRAPHLTGCRARGFEARVVHGPVSGAVVIILPVRQVFIRPYTE